MRCVIFKRSSRRRTIDRSIDRSLARSLDGGAARHSSPFALVRRAMFFGLKLEPGRWVPYVPAPDVTLRAHVSQATAREALSDGARVTIAMRCETDDAVRLALGTSERADDAAEDSSEKEEFRIATLIGGRIESQGLDLVLDEYAEFTCDGPCGVDLTGYYMPEFGDDDVDEEDGMFGDDDDEEEEEDEEFDADAAENMDSEDDEEDSEEEEDDDDDDDDDDSEEDDDDEDDEDEDDEDDEDEDEDESESESEPEAAPKVTRKGGVEIREVEEKKQVGDKRPAEKAPATTPEPKKQVKVEHVKAEAPAEKKPETPKRVHKNGMEIINTYATKNTSAKVASGGKKVAMKYVGKLPSGQIFDQTKGSATFAFRLGVGEVIKGTIQTRSLGRRLSE